jgi:ribosomal protein S18 acetylase RimI-like enzyme
MLARAFLTDPAYTALFPDRAERERALQRLFDAVVGYTLVYGVVHTTPAVEGTACWLSPGNTEVTLWRIARTGFGLQRAVASFNRQARREFLASLNYMDEIHKGKVAGPHWYLWALGVEPGCQGQGIGSQLIQPVLAQADQEGVPCYLETQTEQNVAFYQKRGFEVATEGLVPGQEIRIWTMLREPRR